MQSKNNDRAYRPVIVVPHYEHLEQFKRTLPRLQPVGVDILVVDDGSSAETKSGLAELLADLADVELVSYEVNGGKGQAMKVGLQAAFERRYSHAVQVDADGQHQVEDLPTVLALAKQHPDALISGLPVFDGDIPKARLYGRKFGDFWTTMETLSRRVADAMCGFRVYPLDSVVPLLSKHQLSNRMPFDTEILVVADWSGIALRYFRTPVRYPEDGRSHFHYLHDNLGLVGMHTRLMFGMLMRSPRLLYANFRRGFSAPPPLV